MPEVSLDEVRRFMEEALITVGAPEEEAREHAALLLHADITGHFSHGLNRIDFYINDINGGATVPSAKPVILKESVSTAWVDACNCLGATIGNFCMRLAIEKAKQTGVGWVSAKGCNHFGMAGYWTQIAEREGLIGMAFTNSNALLVPTRAKDRALGTNPISVAAPAKDGDSMVVDMATTAVALGKVEVQILKGESIPEGWAFGPDGKSTTDALEALNTRRLFPLGGLEKTSGYKGYGLSAMVEVFCSGLSGSTPSHNIRPWSSKVDLSPPDLGQCYVAVDPSFFAPGFGDRVADCLNTWRNLEPVDPSLPVLAPGDKERQNAEETKRRGTILYTQQQIDYCLELAGRLNIKPIQIITEKRD